MAKTIKESPESSDITKSMLDSYLNANKESHYNFIENNPIKVSTGSLNLDQHITLTEGVHRFVGYSGAGKSSEALLVMKNFLDDTSEKRKAILVKAEGRLSDNIKNRSGVKFVFSGKEWNNGTCFVFETNSMEFICETLEGIIKSAHDEKERLMIVIDSVDGLRLKADDSKGYEESQKVAGSPLLMKRFLSRMSLPLQKYGVICICLSQISSNIKIDPYSKEAPKMTSGGGGWALVHFANYILEFEARFDGDNIYEHPNAKGTLRGKSLGHWATITIKKSDKENEFQRIKYPIKHGRIGGNSIWIEYEIVDMLLSWSLVKKAGAWFTVSQSLIDEAKGLGLDITVQHQGIDNMRIYLEENPEITNFLFKKFKDVLGK